MLAIQTTKPTPLVTLFKRNPKELLSGEREGLTEYYKCRPEFTSIHPRSAEEFAILCAQRKPEHILLPFVPFHESTVLLPFEPYTCSLLDYSIGYFTYDASSDASLTRAWRYMRFEPGVMPSSIERWRKSA
jgi:hypothetical protein